MISRQGVPCPSFQQGIARSPGESLYPELWKGLIGLWAPSLGHQGLTTLRDFSGYQNHGTFQGSMDNADWAIDSKGYALDYDGTDDHILFGTAGGNAIFTGLTAWTVAGWVKFDALSGNLSPFFGAASVASHPALRIQSSTALRGFAGNGTALFVDLTTSGFTFATGTWYHIAFAFNGTSGNIYVNGVSYASGGSAGTLVDENIYGDRIGGGQNGSVVAFNGQISDVLAYRRGLTPNEIMQSYQGASPLTPKPLIIGKAPAAVGGSVFNPYYYHEHIARCA